MPVRCVPSNNYERAGMAHAGISQIAADVGRWCSGCASGVLGVVDRWLSGPASDSSAQAVMCERRETRFPSGRCRLPLMWVGGVVVARVAWWVSWIAGWLVQLATRASKP